MFTKLYNLWSPHGIERQDTHQNDHLRVFGIVLSPDFREDYHIISRKKAESREEIDNPRYCPKHIYDKFAAAFNDKSRHITQPKNYMNIPHANEMDPNDQSRIAVKRDGKWFKNVFDYTMK